MSANQSSVQKSLSVADRLERKLAKIKAAERKKFLNENIVRLEKNGDLSYEAVRTYRVPIAECREGEAPAEPVGRAVPAAQSNEPAADETQPSDGDLPIQPPEFPANLNSLPNKLPQTPVPQENGNLIAGVARAPTPERWSREANHGSSSKTNDSQNPANLNSLPNKLPQTPVPQENGNLIDISENGVAVFCNAKHRAQPEAPPSLTSNDAMVAVGQEPSPNPGISCHETSTTGNQNDADPLTELLHRAVAASNVRRGRPASLDDQAKGQLTALLAVGMSMRQAAAVLGVSHTTIQKTLKADAALAEEITAARFQAQLQPLACVIREARRSWKAATWLLKYLDGKIASHEETPDERRQRQQRESDEFFARAGGRNVKTRHVTR